MGALPVTSNVQAEQWTVTLASETQTLDLETGMVSEAMQGTAEMTEEADIRIAWNADRVPHAVVVPTDEAVTLAHLEGIGYDVVIATDVATANFSAEAPDRAFGHWDTVLVRTADGSVYKLGYPSEDAMSVNLVYARLQ